MEPFAAFLESLDEGARAAWTSEEGRQALNVALARMQAEANETDPSVLARSLARAATKLGEGPGSLARAHLEDLAVAAAALAGHAKSLDRIEASVASVTASVARTMRLSDAVADEAAQIARVKLLVKVGAGEPVLGRYSGAGPLRAFVASVLGQEALRLVKKSPREVPEEDLSALVLPQLTSGGHLAGGAQIPGGAAVSGAFLDGFKRAFHTALESLDPRERTVLRLTVVDGLTADEIGAGYRVHRVTVARWLRQIRDRLLEETRRLLAADLSISSSGVNAMIDTHLGEVDVSLSRVLREAREEDETEEDA